MCCEDTIARVKKLMQDNSLTIRAVEQALNQTSQFGQLKSAHFREVLQSLFRIDTILLNQLLDILSLSSDLNNGEKYVYVGDFIDYL